MLRRRVMPGTDYIQFADAAIASICANAWGGGATAHLYPSTYSD